MSEFISQSHLVARKDHECNASLYLKECLYDIVGELTFTEKRAVIRACRNGWKVKKGEKYRRYTGKYEGQIFSVADIPDIAAICTRLDLWNE